MDSVAALSTLVRSGFLISHFQFSVQLLSDHTALYKRVFLNGYFSCDWQEGSLLLKQQARPKLPQACWILFNIKDVAQQ